MDFALTLDDVKLIPAEWSNFTSRKDVSIDTNVSGIQLRVPLIASNMDSVYSPELSKKIISAGGQAIVHRFCDIDTNVDLFCQGALTWTGEQQDKQDRPWVSIGVGEYELDRARALYDSGARTFLLDVANAAATHVLVQYQELLSLLPNAKIIVGSFGTKEQIDTFCKKAIIAPAAVLVGQGNGSACITSLVTGIGVPSFSCIQDCVKNKYDVPVILNGGIKNSGDFAKALAAGAVAVVTGRLFAQCLESGAKPVMGQPMKKTYRGSAALSSYEAQGKIAEWRAPEGEEFTVNVTGTVDQLMAQFSGGLRSSMTYCNASNITSFQKNARFMQVTSLGLKESSAYGRIE